MKQADLMQTFIDSANAAIYLKEDADRFRKYDRQVAEAGVPMSFEITFSSADGQHTIIDHKFPVTNVDRAPNAIGGIAIDITTKKQNGLPITRVPA